MKKILITGKDGQVGWELQRSLAHLGKIWAFGREELDLRYPEAICKAIRDIKPDLVVNAAAYTAVDKAESEENDAFAINGEAPGIMAEEAKKYGAVLIHYSTDYVFNGLSKQPYKEADATAPLNIYGKSKLAGEVAVRDSSDKHLILRTSWVYGGRGKNFLLTMLRLGQEKKMLKIVDDQIGAPTWSRMIAEATTHMAAKVCQMPHIENIWGTYHLTSAGQTSWHGFAEEIFNIKKQASPVSVEIPDLYKIPTSEYPLPAARPQYSVLSNSKLNETFQICLPNWKTGLHLCMEKRGNCHA